MTTKKRVVTLMTALTICSVLILSRDLPTASNTVQANVLLADGDKQWYRGNLHTHSLWSDGDDYLEMIGDWYKTRGYDFLCFTDHNVLQSNKNRWVDIAKKKDTGTDAYNKLKKRFPDWVEERKVKGRTEVRLRTFAEVSEKLAVPGEFLLIQGEEITDRFKNSPVHMNATNIQSLIPPLGGDSVYETMQNNVNAVIAQRERTKQPILVHLNHPNFGYGVTAEDLMRVRGENFYEVYNGHPGVNNSGNDQHSSCQRIWDIILTKRLAELGLPVMYGLATDDGHRYHNIPSRASEPGRGWVEVLASQLTPAALIEALEKGDFYSSSGVKLKQVSSSKQALKVVVNAEPGVSYRIDFIGTRTGYDKTSKPVLDKKNAEIRATRIYSDDIGQVFKTVKGTTATYEIGDKDIYVRALVTSTKKHPNPSEVGEFERAWVQPVVGQAKP
jgi:hypothetical protein